MTTRCAKRSAPTSLKITKKARFVSELDTYICIFSTCMLCAILVSELYVVFSNNWTELSGTSFHLGAEKQMFFGYRLIRPNFYSILIEIFVFCMIHYFAKDIIWPDGSNQITVTIKF